MVQIQIVAGSTAAAAISRGLTDMVATAEAFPHSPAPACLHQNTLTIEHLSRNCNLSSCTQCSANALSAQLCTCANVRRKQVDESETDVPSKLEGMKCEFDTTSNW